jgi:ATP-binding cassette, subfamily B, multidrug efflux pump
MMDYSVSLENCVVTFATDQSRLRIHHPSAPIQPGPRASSDNRAPPTPSRPQAAYRQLAAHAIDPSMFALFENLIRPTERPGTAPPQRLMAFYWHYVRQTKGLFGAMFVTGLVVALIDTLIPVFIGRMVRLMEAQDRAAALADALPMLIGMALLVLIGRPLALLMDSLVRNNAVVPGVTSLIRWQSHWHVVRQSLPFFQNDFAGRIANRVMQTSNAVRECVVSSIRAVWYIVIYGLSALVLMGMADWRLAVPTALWFVGYVVFLRIFVPQMRDLAKTSSELRSMVMGRVVDSYTNILTVKLFARVRDEDNYVREVIDDHTGAIRAHMRLITRFMTTLSALNALLLVSTAASASRCGARARSTPARWPPRCRWPGRLPTWPAG